MCPLCILPEHRHLLPIGPDGGTEVVEVVRLSEFGFARPIPRFDRHWLTTAVQELARLLLRFVAAATAGKATI